MAGDDRPRGPGLAPELVQGHPRRPVAAPARGRLLRQPSPAGCGGLRAGGPLPLGHREPRPPRPRPRPARGRQPDPAPARRLRPVALVRAQHPARGRGQQRERGGLRQRPQPRPAPGLRPPQITELNSPGPPGVSGHPPIDSFEQIAELPRCNRHDTLGGRRPDEPTVLQPLHEETHALGVMPQDLDQVTPAAAKDEKMAGVRVALEHLLHLEREPVHALAHVGAAGGQPDPRPARERDHRPTRARSAAVTVVGSGAPEMRTRPPSASSISISPKGAGTASATGRGAAGAISTAAKPGILAAGTPRPIPAPNRLRQPKSWLGLTPLRRATPCTVSPDANVSATRRRLSSSDQRRRARPWKISTRPMRSLQGPV